MVWIEKSVTRVTDRHHEACQVMRNSDSSDRFFYPHHTPMTDTLSCIPFDLPHLIFNKELAIKQHFSVKEFLLMFIEIDATSDRRSVLYVSF